MITSKGEVGCERERERRIERIEMSVIMFVCVFEVKSLSVSVPSYERTGPHVNLGCGCMRPVEFVLQHFVYGHLFRH